MHNAVETYRGKKDLEDFALAESNPSNLRIGWIDGSRLMREGMPSAILRGHPWYIIISFECDGVKTMPIKSLNPSLKNSHEPNTAMLKEMPILKQSFASARLLVSSGTAAPKPAIVRDSPVRRSGGLAVTDRTGLQIAASAINLVSSGGTCVPRDFLLVNDRASEHPLERKAREPTRLTLCESAGLELVRHGKRNKIIANELGMSTRYHQGSYAGDGSREPHPSGTECRQKSSLAGQSQSETAIWYDIMLLVTVFFNKTSHEHDVDRFSGRFRAYSLESTPFSEIEPLSSKRVDA